MTYLGFLLIFLGIPLLALGALAARDNRSRSSLQNGRWRRTAAIALLVHVVIAVTYTTPWDNYLVATSVWWYDTERVLGITLGWVPLEEYMFFVLQPLMTGLLLFALLRRLRPERRGPADGRLRLTATAAIAAVWLGAVLLLASGWQPGTYMGLQLAWALPPVGLQLAVGADILWRYRRAVFTTIAAASLYLGAADYLAIASGIWTIDPAQSFNIFIGGVLPLEEATFFVVANTLVVFGLTLSLAPQTWERWSRLRAWLVELRERARLLNEGA